VSAAGVFKGGKPGFVGLLFENPKRLDARFFFHDLQHATPNMSSFFLLLAQAQGAPSKGQGMSQLLFFGLIFAAMWFLMIAPQRKKQKEHDKMLQALDKGDEIVTTGGIVGTIVAVKDDRFVLRVADETKLELAKSFVSSVVKKSED
jgi:preprotein translocase subunit YajC